MMTLRRIAVRTEVSLSDGDRAAVETACRLALARGAELDVLANVTEVLPTMQVNKVEDMTFNEARQELEAIGARHGVALRVIDRSSYAHGGGEVFADHMRVSDLGVMHFPKEPSIAARMVATTAVFQGGVPLLLLPDPGGYARPPASIVVGWNGSAAASHALRAAIALAGNDGKLTVVALGDGNTHRPGQSGIEAAHLAAMHGVTAAFETVDAGEDAAVDRLERHCADLGADLLVLGAVRHGSLHELLFGSVTKDLLHRGARLPTLLVA